jgi:AcrR family transcriptional regulator
MISAGDSANTRDRLLETVERLMSTQGLARISTRDIARESGLAEGTLYNYFRDKEEIFIAVLQRNAGKFRETLQDLPMQVAQRTVRETLEEVAEAAYKFYSRNVSRRNGGAGRSWKYPVALAGSGVVIAISCGAGMKTIVLRLGRSAAERLSGLPLAAGVHQPCASGDCLAHDGVDFPFAANVMAKCEVGWAPAAGCYARIMGEIRAGE